MKTEAQIWDEVLDEVRERWTCGSLERQGAGERKMHCAIGAIAYVVFGKSWNGRYASEYTLLAHSETGLLMSKLAQCLVDLNPDSGLHSGSNVDVSTIIIRANDNMGQQTIIEAVEKARAL